TGRPGRPPGTHRSGSAAHPAAAHTPRRSTATAPGPRSQNRLALWALSVRPRAPPANGLEGTVQSAQSALVALISERGDQNRPSGKDGEASLSTVSVTSRVGVYADGN